MSANIALRPLASTDRDRLLSWRNQPDVARWMYTDHEISPQEHDAWLARALADPSRAYWIIEVEGAPVGLANLADISRAHGRASWAYYLASPSTRGLGVGAYVEFWVIEHVFNDLGLNKLCCEVLHENEAVWRMHMSFGFAQEGLLRQHICKAGQRHDVVVLGLLAEDWRMVRNQSLSRLQARGFNLE